MSLRHTVAALALTSLIAAPLSACVTPSLQKYDDKADACNTYREPLLQTEEDFGTNVVGGAVIGALLGGLAGAASGQGSEGVAIGVIGGALLGGGAGYMKGKQDQAKSQQAILEEIDQDARQDGMRLSRTSGTISQLTSCRSRQIDSITTAYKAGSIDQPQAKMRLARVQASIEQDKMLLADVLEGTGRRADMYIDAKAQATKESREQVLGDVALIKTDDFIRTDTDFGETFISKSASNVRSEPSRSADIVGSLSVGETVIVTDGPTDGWYEIDLDGDTAYVHRSLLAEAGSAAAKRAEARASSPTTGVREANNSAKMTAPQVKDARSSAKAGTKVASAEQVMTVDDNVQGIALQHKQVEAEVQQNNTALNDQLALAAAMVGGGVN